MLDAFFRLNYLLRIIERNLLHEFLKKLGGANSGRCNEAYYYKNNGGYKGYEPSSCKVSSVDVLRGCSEYDIEN